RVCLEGQTFTTGSVTTLQPADKATAGFFAELVPASRVADYLCTVERRTQNRSVGNLTTQTTTHTTVHHIRYGVLTQSVRIGANRQRRATGQADAGVIAGTRIRVHTKALAHYAFACRHGFT